MNSVTRRLGRGGPEKIELRVLVKSTIQNLNTEVSPILGLRVQVRE